MAKIFHSHTLVTLLLLSILSLLPLSCANGDHQVQNDITLKYFASFKLARYVNGSFETIGEGMFYTVELLVKNMSSDNAMITMIVRKPTLEEFRTIANIYNVIIPLNMSLENYYNYLYNHTMYVRAKYVISKLNNYVIGDTRIGFFPLYSTIELTKDVIKKLRPVFNNKPLDCSEEGCYVIASSSAYPDMIVLELTSPDGKPTLLFRRHYLVAGYDVNIPINDSYVIYFSSIVPYPSTVDVLLSVPDYKLFGPDYGLYALIAAIIAMAAIIAYIIRRRLTRQ